MFRLVWKDAVAARLLLLAALPVYALNLAAMSAVRPIFAMVVLLFSGVLAFGSMAMESVQGTGMLWASLPVRRRDIVLARYLTAVLGAGLGLGISLFVERVMIRVRSGGSDVASEVAGRSLGLSAASHLILMLLLLLTASILLPLCFRLGAGNGTLAFGAVCMGGMLLLTVGGQLVLWLAGVSNPILDPDLWSGRPDPEQVEAMRAWLQQRGPALLGVSTLVVALITAVSAGISCRIYQARDIAP